MSRFPESVVEEDAALAWLEALGDAVAHGPEIAAGEPAAERRDPAGRRAFLAGSPIDGWRRDLHFWSSTP